MENMNATILNKFEGLVAYLTQIKSAFEMVADEIEDCNLKTAFNGLSAESLQYADELTFQLKAHGISYNIPLTSVTGSSCGIMEDNRHQGKGAEVSFFCSSSERQLTAAYCEILDDHLLFAGIKEIMSYQLNALIFSFMKIRLLNLTRFS